MDRDQHADPGCIAAAPATGPAGRGVATAAAAGTGTVGVATAAAPGTGTVGVAAGLAVATPAGMCVGRHRRGVEDQGEADRPAVILDRRLHDPGQRLLGAVVRPRAQGVARRLQTGALVGAERTTEQQRAQRGAAPSQGDGDRHRRRHPQKRRGRQRTCAIGERDAGGQCHREAGEAGSRA
jgi:hypothetical protein